MDFAEKVDDILEEIDHLRHYLSEEEFKETFFKKKFNLRLVISMEAEKLLRIKKQELIQEAPVSATNSDIIEVSVENESFEEEKSEEKDETLMVESENTRVLSKRKGKEIVIEDDYDYNYDYGRKKKVETKKGCNENYDIGVPVNNESVEKEGRKEKDDILMIESENTRVLNKRKGKEIVIEDDYYYYDYNYENGRKKMGKTNKGCKEIPFFTTNYDIGVPVNNEISVEEEKKALIMLENKLTRVTNKRKAKGIVIDDDYDNDFDIAKEKRSNPKKRSPKKSKEKSKENAQGGPIEKNIPEHYKEFIEKLLHGKKLELMAQKKLSSTDVKPSENRLIFSMDGLQNNNFLTIPEIESINNNRTYKIQSRLVVPSTLDRVDHREYIKFGKMYMGENSYYALVSPWREVVATEKFKVGDVVQVWTFRYETDGLDEFGLARLGIAIVKLDITPGSSSGSGSGGSGVGESSGSGSGSGNSGDGSGNNGGGSGVCSS